MNDVSLQLTELFEKIAVKIEGGDWTQGTFEWEGKRCALGHLMYSDELVENYDVAVQCLREATGLPGDFVDPHMATIPYFNDKEIHTKEEAAAWFRRAKRQASMIKEDTPT